jgi:hypothetical protein
MMIDRVRQSDLDDMIDALINFSILSKDPKKKTVCLQVELKELSDALAVTQDDRFNKK